MRSIYCYFRQYPHVNHYFKLSKIYEQTPPKTRSYLSAAQKRDVIYQQP